MTVGIIRHHKDGSSIKMQEIYRDLDRLLYDLGGVRDLLLKSIMEIFLKKKRIFIIVPKSVSISVFN